MPSPARRLRQFIPHLLLTALASATACADSVVVFNEIHYHPASATDPEWIELHNQMPVRVDLSGWTLRGGIDHTFPAGTVIEAGGYLLVTPPWSGSLANEGRPGPSGGAS